jgi:hypothetical protein
LEDRVGFLDMFRTKPHIRDAAGLATFIDEHAAFLVQKGIYEYSRARAGHYAKVLMREPEFVAAADASRWRAYPLGLAMVAEMVEGVLHPHGSGARQETIDALAALVLSVFDRYPVPAALDEATWAEARSDLVRRLSLISLHPPKPAIDIPEPFAESYFDLMPIHKNLRGRDFPTTRNYLRVTMANIHDELTKRVGAPAALVDALRTEFAN